MTIKQKIADFAIGVAGLFVFWFVILWVATGQM